MSSTRILLFKPSERLGLSLNPDGFEDHEIKIKGLLDIKVGGFAREEPEPEMVWGASLKQMLL
jgi:hypothetical protein